MPLTKLKIAAFAPMPTASVRIATAAKPGALRSVRNPYRMSCHNCDIQPPPDRIRIDGTTRARLASGSLVLSERSTPVVLAHRIPLSVSLYGVRAGMFPEKTKTTDGGKRL